MPVRLFLILICAISAQAQTQLLFSTWFVETTQAQADDFQEQAAGSEDPSALYELLMRSSQADIDILSAPRVITLPGSSAEIKIVSERSFQSGLEKDAAGDWAPTFESRELGITVLVNAQPLPASPTQVQGAFEATISELASETQKQVQLPGQDPVTLQIPVIQERKLTAGFIAESGETMLIGRLEQADKKVVLVLLRTEVQGTALVKRLKKIIVPALMMKDTALDDALTFLQAQNKQAKLRLFSQATNASPVTISVRNIPLYDALRQIAKISGTKMVIDGETVTFTNP